MMANRPAAITQNELTGYAKAMQEAGISEWSVEVDKPDGTRVRLVAGSSAPAARGTNLDKRLGIRHG